MEWLSQNWPWLLIGAFAALYLFGHRGHGKESGHSGCGGRHARVTEAEMQGRGRPKTTHDGHAR